MIKVRASLFAVLLCVCVGIARGQSVHHGHFSSVDASSSDAPADARDPHAYSGGYRLGTGLYAPAPARTLMMADEHGFASLRMERLERVDMRDGHATAYEGQAWIGNSYDKFVIKAEGGAEQGKLAEARTELLWSQATSPFWDTQLGWRNDAGSGRPGRNWLAFGVQGMAPYWLDVGVTAYVGQGGRMALRLSADYELKLTQRLILQPKVEADFYGKEDAAIHAGRGMSHVSLGLRLRYEMHRQFAPYVGIERSQHFGRTASLVRAAGERGGETRVVAGVRFWF